MNIAERTIKVGKLRWLYQQEGWHEKVSEVLIPFLRRQGVCYQF